MKRTEKDKKLIINPLFTNKFFLYAIYLLIFLFCFFALNAIFTLFSNIRNIFENNFSYIQLLIPSWKFRYVYLASIGISTILCFIIRHKMHVNFGEMNAGQKGHARFMTENEVKERFRCVPKKNKSFKGRGSMPVSSSNTSFYLDNDPVNNLILAISRSGKSQKLVIPTIDLLSRAEEKTSMIVSDVKGELATVCVPFLLQRDYNVYILDFADPHGTKGHHYNPLKPIMDAYLKDDISSAQQLCENLAHILYQKGSSKDVFWDEASRSLFISLILGKASEYKDDKTPELLNMFNILSFLSKIAKDTADAEMIAAELKMPVEDPLDTYFSNFPQTHPARMRYLTTQMSQGRTRSTILTVTINKLAIFTREDIALKTAYSDFNLTDIGFGKKPVAVFIAPPFYDDSFNEIVSILISQAFYLNMQKATLEGQGKCKRYVRVVGDEFFNFPSLPSMETMISVCLGANWSFDLYAQSNEQVAKSYGEQVAKIVLDNCATTYFLASPSKTTREKIAELIGKYTQKNVSRSGKRFSLSKNISEQYDERFVITPQELMELTDGDVIVYPTLHRKDLHGKTIIPLPIFNTGKQRFESAFEYLPNYSTKQVIPYQEMNYVSVLPQNMITSLFETEQESKAVIPKGKLTTEKPFVQEKQDKPLDTLKDTVNDEVFEQIEKIFKESGLELDMNAISLSEFKEMVHINYNMARLDEDAYQYIQSMLD